MRGWSQEAGVTIVTGRLVIDTCTLLLLLLLLDDVSVATSVAIEHCCYQETANYSLLALVCNNGEKREWLVGVVYYSTLRLHHISTATVSMPTNHQTTEMV